MGWGGGRVAPHGVALCCSVGHHNVFTYCEVLFLLLLHSLFPRLPNSASNLKTIDAFNLLAPELFFLILAHPVYKM